MEKVFEALDKLEECAVGMEDLPKSNWGDLAENQAELDLKIMDWVETIKFELFKGKQALNELKAIKEANPSEVLECLENLDKNGCFALDKEYESVNIIKQVLLKEQKNEKTLETIKNHLSFKDAGIATYNNQTKYLVEIESKDTGATIHIHLNKEEEFDY